MKVKLADRRRTQSAAASGAAAMSDMTASARILSSMRPILDLRLSFRSPESDTPYVALRSTRASHISCIWAADRPIMAQYGTSTDMEGLSQGQSRQHPREGV